MGVKDCNLEGEEICSTEYESECVTEQHEHQVEDDVPECRTVVDEKCEDITSGYTSSQKCSKWPREECVLSKQNRKKYTQQTKCEKIPVTLCGPAGCGFVEGDEVCYERTPMSKENPMSSAGSTLTWTNATESAPQSVRRLSKMK